MCDQRYQSKVNREPARPRSLPAAVPHKCIRSDLTEPIDIYSEWIDAADAAQREDQIARRATTSSSKAVREAASEGSDDE